MGTIFLFGIFKSHNIVCATRLDSNNNNNLKKKKKKKKHFLQNAGLGGSADMVTVEMVTVCVLLSEVIITPLTGLPTSLSHRELTLTMTAIFDKTLPQQLKLRWECY